jgi:pyruvate/2-oxoglutarate/acetoin dehydrogenase E1 component
MKVRELQYREALNEALHEEMVRDPSVCVLGEDVGRYGSPFQITRGLFEKYGEKRVRDTPISEEGFTGIAVGAAMTGLRPVAEILYIDFSTLAMDQIVNQAAKARYMFGGKARVPLVIRTQGGGGRGNAAHHSQSLEMWYVHVPGLIVIQPSTPYDAKGLLKSAIRNDNPVIFIEHKLLYNTTGPVPDEEYLIPIGVADVKRPGDDVTIVATSRMVRFALNAAEDLARQGIEAEVIDPRTLKPLDIDTIVRSVEKTGRLVVVNEGHLTGGFTAEVAARVQREAFDWLDAPIMQVATEDVPLPYNGRLELEAIPNEQDIINAVLEVVYRLAGRSHYAGGYRRRAATLQRPPGVGGHPQRARHHQCRAGSHLPGLALWPLI